MPAATTATIHELKVGGLVLLLRADETPADELQRLLTAALPPPSAGQRAVALQCAQSGRVFPLDVVSARPDVVVAASASSYSLLYSHTPATGILRQLLLQGQLSEKEHALLSARVDEDPFLQAAIEVFLEERDEADLVDTLRRIVAIRVVSPARSAQSATGSLLTQASSSVSSSTSQLDQSTILQELEDELELAEFPSSLVLDLIAARLDAGDLTVNDAAVLRQLASKELPHLQAAYEVHALEQSVPNLVQTLKRISKHYGVERVLAGAPYAEDVLKAFRDGDVKVCGAWDVYVDERDAADFLDTLTRIAQRWGGEDTTVAAAGTASTPVAAKTSTGGGSNTVGSPSEEKQALRKMVLWLHSEMKLSGEEGHALMRVIDQGHAGAEQAMREFTAEKTPQAQQELINTVLALVGLADDDDEDEEEGSTSGSGEDDEDEDEAYFGPLRELLLDFVSNQVATHALTQHEGARLGQLANRRDARLYAAFDLYLEERDEEDLLDSLHHLCRHDENEEEEDEEEEEGSVDYNMDELYDMIESKDWLSAGELALVRDALDSQNERLEEIISRYVETDDDDEFRSELELFCSAPAEYDAGSILAAVRKLGLKDRDFALVQQHVQQQDANVEAALYAFVDTNDFQQLKRDLVKFCRLTVDNAYDPDSIFSIIRELGLTPEQLQVIKERADAADGELEHVLYEFVENEDLGELKQRLVDFADAAGVEDRERLVDRLGLQQEVADLIKDALEAQHPDCEAIWRKFHRSSSDPEALKQALSAWAQTQL